MTEPTHPALPIEPHHVRAQFARRGDLAGAAFLYDEIGQRMLERLAYIRLAPLQILDAGCGTGQALAGLRARYPQAGYTGLDHCEPLLERARLAHVPPRAGLAQRWLDRLRAPRGDEPTHEPQFRLADLAATGLSPESQDLVWSNLALHWHPRPHAVLAEWRRIVRVNGLAMFSCFGPGTLREVREALAHAGLRTATMPFVDMHDFGDLLVETGFADPVMDQEIITLTYREPAKLLADLRALGGNAASGRRPGLAGRGFRDRLLAALEARRGDDGLIRLTLEIAYGHAWRSAARRAAGETHISVSSIGRGPRPE